jgi:hypothetical protein
VSTGVKGRVLNANYRACPFMLGVSPPPEARKENLMSTRLAATAFPGNQRSAGPVYRSIVVVDIEGSTMRTNPVKGELRRIMYDLLGRALADAGITGEHLDEITDRGDGALLLVRPHDDLPKTVLLDRLIPFLAALLAEYNERVPHPALQMRLRAVVHAGEVHADDRGFYGESIEIAIRMLDSPPVKKALKETASPLVLVVSDEIHSSIVSHGYSDTGAYWPLVRVRVADRPHRGWVHVPEQAAPASVVDARNGRVRIPLAVVRGSGPGAATDARQEAPTALRRYMRHVPSIARDAVAGRPSSRYDIR